MRVFRTFLSSNSHSKLAKKLSAIALSYASPTLPMDGRTPSTLQRFPKAKLVYWLQIDLHSPLSTRVKAVCPALMLNYMIPLCIVGRVNSPCPAIGTRKRMGSCHRDLSARIGARWRHRIVLSGAGALPPRARARGGSHSDVAPHGKRAQSRFHITVVRNDQGGSEKNIRSLDPPEQSVFDLSSGSGETTVAIAQAVANRSQPICTRRNYHEELSCFKTIVMPFL